MTGDARTDKSYGPEFWLVVSMICALIGLVFIVLIIPVQLAASTDAESLTGILKFRQETLTIIVTAFSAWIGAGAAYFFGRENLKQATEGMLKAIESPRQKLQKTLIRDIPPRKIAKIVNTTDAFETLLNDIIKDAAIWFVAVVDKKGVFKKAIHEEAIYRYKLKLDAEKAETEKLTVDDLLGFIDSCSDDSKELDKFWITMDIDDNLGTAEVLMAHEKARIAILVDGKGAPTDYISTGDIRRYLLKE